MKKKIIKKKNREDIEINKKYDPIKNKIIGHNVKIAIKKSTNEYS